MNVGQCKGAGDTVFRVLLIEDNPGDVRLLLELLRDARFVCIDMTCAASLKEALRLAEYLRFDLFLTDLNLPDSNGFETFLRLQETAPDVPVVVLSGMADETIAMKAVQSGAQDYLIKGEMDGNLLARSLRYAIERHRMKMELRSLTLEDELTSLHNRRGFQTLAEQQIKTAERLGQKMMLLFADLDGLKEINDRSGHGTGDVALRETADLLRKTFRDSDIIARLGGDEFVVLVIVEADEDEKALTKRLAENLEEFNLEKGHPYNISLSMGVAHYDPAAPCSIEILLERADIQMYTQKKSKKRL